MRHLIRLTDYTKQDIFTIFKIADDIRARKYEGFLQGKTVALFFPSTSIRTRITFEKGVWLLGGQSVVFPPETLNKPESPADVAGYLGLWADAVIIRHGSIHVQDELSRHAIFPVINAMTDVNHPCEILDDLYALSQIRQDYLHDQYLFCGARGNIGLAWKEAAEVLGLSLSQCCPPGYEMANIPICHELRTAIQGQDIICTDSLPTDAQADFKDFQITRAVMNAANAGAVLNPCPPFFWGEEVSTDAIESSYFAGYAFKKHLLEVQQAILIFSMTH